MISVERDDGDICEFLNIYDAWKIILYDRGTDETQISVIQVFSERWVLGNDLFHWYEYNGTDKKTYNQLERKLKKISKCDYDIFIECGRGEIISFIYPQNMLQLIIDDFLSGDPNIYFIKNGMLELHRYDGTYWYDKDDRIYSYINLFNIIC